VSAGAKCRAEINPGIHVVDGENDGHIAKRGILGIERAQQNRYEGRLPVVAVEYVGHAQYLRSFNHGPGEQGEAFGVIGIVAADCVERSRSKYGG